MIKDLVKALIIASPIGAFEYHPFGFVRLRVSDTVRIHMWGQGRTDEVDMIHDHRQWSFTSQVLCGRIIDHSFNLDRMGKRWMKGTIQAGHQGPRPREQHEVGLVNEVQRIVTPGNSYTMSPEEIHWTEAKDGTVTVIEQKRNGTDQASVFWPKEREWIPARPVLWENMSDELKIIVDSIKIRCLQELNK